MKKYEQLESQIQELQAEVERLKQEEKAEQIDLSTCIAGQLVQLRNGDFEYYDYKDEAGFCIIGGDAYNKDGSCYGYGNSFESVYDVVKVFPTEIPVPDRFPGRFHVFYAKKVLEGDISSLGNSFIFADTPQGKQYWIDIHTGKTHLSFGDIILIQKWIIQTQS
jgi:hypothetical protein